MDDANASVRPDGPDIDYQTYRFGRRQRLYRGPRPDLSRPYVAFVGAERTFGVSVRRPFPDLVGEAIGAPVANLAVEGAGPGFVLEDSVTLEACCRAELCVVEATGIWSVSNRLYSVGRRYNRRLRAVSPTLRSLYPKVDFESFDYVARMLETICREDDERFLIVEKECRDAWTVRTRQLLEAIETRTILFWFSERPPACLTHADARRALSIYPEGVDAEMLERVAPAADGYAECVYSTVAPAGEALTLPAAPSHEAAAEAVAARVLEVLGPDWFA